MTTVAVVKNWAYPDMRRQTPEGDGVWGDVRFTENPDTACDYVIVCNHAASPTTVRCPPDHVWAIMQEPPVGRFAARHCGAPVYGRVYTSREGLRGARYIHAPPALAWHVERTYTELREMAPPHKVANLSCITSTKAAFPGHRRRLSIVQRLSRELQMDLYGKGIRFVEDKTDALAPYRYSLVIENHRNRNYWSEKLTDCLLSWTVPIYDGCTEIQRWFPPQAVVAMDLAAPDAAARIGDLMDTDDWEARLDALAAARRDILDRYQFYPFFAQEIAAHQAAGCSGPQHRIAQEITIPVLGPPWRYRALDALHDVMPQPLWRIGASIAHRVTGRHAIHLD